MKKLILKTAFITLGAALVFVALVFVIVSSVSPVTMMNLTASMGMDGASGDYAYSAYSRTEEISYLAYSCEMAAIGKENKSVIGRSEELFAREEEFASYCAERDGTPDKVPESISKYVAGSYAQYLYGQYVCALYRTGETDKAVEFAIGAAESEFSENNAAIALAMECREQGDKEFCKTYAERLSGCSAKDHERCKDIIKILEDFANE